MPRHIITSAALLALLTLVTVAEARSLSGEVLYRERIALAPGAEMVVEARDSEGVLVGELRQTVGDGQVQLPFALDVPEGDLTLRAAIVVGGQPAWASAEVPVPASTDDTAIGPVLVSRFQPMGFASTFRCGEANVTVGFLGDHARLRIGGTYHDLAPMPAASGARFEAPGDPGTFAWSRGNAFSVSVRGAVLPECQLAVGETLAPFVARGNEPFWTLTIEDGTARYQRMGEDAIDGALSQPTPDGAARAYEVAGTDLGFDVTDILARDSMTGMPYPQTVVVRIGGETLTGMGGDPRALLTGGEWRAEDVLGKGIPDNARVTATFTAEGRVAGLAGCNRYTGGYTLSGEGFSFGPAAATRMACPEALMTLERDVFDAFSRTARFDIDDTGALVLLASDGTRLMLLRH